MMQIMADTAWFMLIFLTFLVALTLAFHTIGKNQIYSEEFDREIPYSTYLGALDHVYKSALGELSTKTYYGDDMQIWLIPLFTFMSFFLTILLLNMLIAMMSESFQKNNEEGEAKKKMSELEFVVNNWYIDPIKNKDRIVYIIAAKSSIDEDDTDERFEHLERRLDRIQTQQENLISEIKGNEIRLDRIINKLTAIGGMLGENFIQHI